MTMTTDTNGLAAHLAQAASQTPEDAQPEQAGLGQSVDLVPAAPMAPAPMAPDFRITPPKVVGGLPYASTYMRLAKTIHGTEMVPASFRGRPDAVMAAMLRGFEMGLPPLQSLDSFNVIQGKVGLTAEAMRALIIGAGHQFILETAPDGAVVSCHRSDWPDDKWVEVSYTMADARTAQLTGKDSWKKNPQAMLDARATSKAGRRYFPDVLAGMSYTPEEIADFDRPGAPASPKAEIVTVTQPSPQQEPVGNPEPASDPSPSPTEADVPALAADPPPLADSMAEAITRGRQRATTERAKAPAETLPDAEEPGVRAELRKGLVAVIQTLSRPQQSLVRGYLAQHGLGDVGNMTAEQLTEATKIAAGWPTSVAGHAEEHTGEIVDAEIVDGDRSENAEEMF